MKIETIPKMTLAEFAEKHDLEIIVKERPRPAGDPARFYAYLDRAEVMQDGMLTSEFGDGPTIEEAIQNAHSSYNLKRLAIDAFGNTRREIEPHRIEP